MLVTFPVVSSLAFLTNLSFWQNFQMKINSFSQIGIIGSVSNWTMAVPVVLSGSPINCSAPALTGGSTNTAVISSSQMTFSGTYPNCIMTLSITGGTTGYTTLTVTSSVGTTTAWKNLDVYILAPPTSTFALWDAVQGFMGNIINVRRSTDNTTLDIGFVSTTGNLNSSTLTAFESGGSGYVAKWYDQSGGGDNATQVINASQPQISTGITFNGTSESLSLNSIFSTLTSFAVETWVNAGAPSTAGSMILTNAEGTATMNGFQLRQSTAPPNRAEFVVGQKFYSYRDYVLSLQPVGYWRLDETSGTTAYDLSAYGNNGTYTGGFTLGQSGALIGAGDNDSSVLLDGSTGYINISSVPNAVSVTSISMWVNPANSNATWALAISGGTGDSAAANCYIKTTTALPYCYTANTGGTQTSLSSTVPIRPGQWNHIVFTFNTTGRTVYVNGKAAGSDAQNIAPLRWQSIGNVGSYYLNGSIDEAVIFNYALTATQVANLYHQGNSLYQNVVLADSPILYYRFDEASGATSAVDLSGNGNTGTYQNSPTLGVPGSGALVDDLDTAAILNGTSQYVSTTTQYTHPQTLSEEIWFKTGNGYSAGGKLVGFGSAQTGASSGYDCHIWMDNGGLIRYGVQSNGGPLFSIVSPTAYNDGNWHHAVGTFTANSWLLYLDSILVASNTALVALANYSGYWRFGYDNFTSWVDAPSSSYFQGALDEGAIYNTVLTPTQVANHFRAGTPNRALVIQDKPVGYWRLNESSGTTVYDLSGNGNYLTYAGGYTLNQSGALTTSGDNDTSVLFDGSTGGITGSDVGLPSGQTPRSVSVWAYPTNLSSLTLGTLFVWGTSTAESAYGLGIKGSSGTTSLYNFGWADDWELPYALSANNWYHIVSTFNGTTAQLFVNGVLAGTSSRPNWNTSSNSLYVGKDFGNTYYFPGNIDELSIFNYVLSPPQILDLYQTGTTTHKDGVPYPGNAILADHPLGYWRLGEKSGQIAYDYSGNGNNGSYVGPVGLGQAGITSSAGDGDSSILLNGSNTNVNMGSVPVIQNLPQVTLATWIKSSSSGQQTIMGQEALFKLQFRSGNQLGFLASTTGGGWTINFGGTANYLNTWTHVAGTYNGTTATIYVNGLSVATTSMTGSLGTNSNNFILGSFAGGEPVTGLIDEAAIFNYALSSVQISTLYNSGLGSGWWYCQSQSQLNSSYWNLLTGIYNGTTAQLFVNGQQECSVTPGTQYSGSLSTTFVGATAALTNFWNGVMSYLSLFGSASTPTTAANVYTNFGGTANRFRTTPIENIVTTNLVAHFDAANAQLGTSAYTNGCPTSALSWFDLSPNSNNATLFNFSSCGSTTGWYSGSASGPFYLAFNGSNNYANVPLATSLSTYTFEAWTFITAASVGSAVLSSAGTLQAYLQLSSGASWQFNHALAPTPATLNQWTHVVGVQNTGANSIYVNGVQLGTATFAVSVAGVDIGRRGDGIYFNGGIGVARVYSTALTLQQIKQNCYAQQARFGVTACAYP